MESMSHIFGDSVIISRWTILNIRSHIIVEFDLEIVEELTKLNASVI